MFRIIYVSTATRPAADLELSRMLAEARRRNAAADITGMLVFNGTDFLQVLEGEPSNVIATFERIARDQRHAEVAVLQRGIGYGQRLFADWAMGYRTLSEDEPGHMLLNARLDLRRLDEISALDFLKDCSRATSARNS